MLKSYLRTLIFISSLLISIPTLAEVSKGKQLYQSELSTPESVSNWRMEGPGEVTFNNGWLQMHSPNEEMHHVFWSPMDFPDSFIAEWEVQNLKFDAGLVIVFFAAQSVNGEDIFSKNVAKRDGTFEQYTLGDINSYHISYYTNAAHNPDRGHANLRKNNTFTLLQQGQEGIPTLSRTPHKIRLVKNKNHISMFIDERKVIDYKDNIEVIDGVNIGKPLGSGKIGFRQMKWTKFQYRNFKVWQLNEN
ncbi:MAG: DUF1961 family protein [Pseudoalteromonas prydzensis]|uniref:DUF1961 family protein n=1 Tax=Pseudoalteromonas prydzensis TaxID=182141 RepID=UPI003F95706E